MPVKSAYKNIFLPQKHHHSNSLIQAF